MRNTRAGLLMESEVVEYDNPRPVIGSRYLAEIGGQHFVAKCR